MKRAILCKSKGNRRDERERKTVEKEALRGQNVRAKTRFLLRLMTVLPLIIYNVLLILKIHRKRL